MDNITPVHEAIPTREETEKEKRLGRDVWKELLRVAIKTGLLTPTELKEIAEELLFS